MRFDIEGSSTALVYRWLLLALWTSVRISALQGNDVCSGDCFRMETGDLELARV